MKDLVLLVADRNMEFTLRGLLGRPEALAIRPVAFDLYVHPRHDPGCLHEAHDFLRPLSRDYKYAMVLFDHQGCGREDDPPEVLSTSVKERLARSGWDQRADVVILAPELEVWVWSASPHVETCLGWVDRQPSLRDWLAEAGHWPPGTPKPPQPKEAMEAALRQVRKPRSSAIYLELAQQVSLQGHDEPAFLRLAAALRRWFPQ